MGKKKTAGNLGRSIIKDRFGKRTIPKGDSFLHTSELNDGYDWGRLNLQSVTEQSNLDDFLATAELAGTEFTAEKLNVKFVDPKGGTSLLSDVEKSRISKLHDDHRQLLRIPRRPQWDENTSAEELDQNEKAAFLSWRRELASLQEIEGIVMTPYEKNLDFWRQLWRVIERSDVIIQVVDARNPLLFRCQDVEEYVKEVSTDKQNLLLVNKADFLTEHQRKQWCKYFDNVGIKAVFWSALEESERQAKEVKEMEGNEEMEGDMVPDSASESNEEELSDVVSKRLCVEKESSVCVRNRLNGDEEETITSESETLGGDEASAFSVSKRLDGDKKEYVTGVSKGPSGDNALDTSQSSTQSNLPLSTERKVFTNNMECKDTRQDFGDKDSVTESVDNDFCDKYGASPSLVTKETRLLSNEQQLTNSTEILSGPKLIKFLKHYHSGRKVQDDLTTIGMIGYPNVGKSSTINAILKMKKVPVSATPGRTKHFQTLYVDEDLMLCDCPGLVFPSFVCTKAELILNGVLPIDQMRDHVPPISLTCQYIPRDILELTYGINLPVPGEGEDPTRDPSAEELLSSYGHMRGYMTANGMPDCPRASRYILKDFVNGRLLFCQAPPGVDQKEFNSKTVSSVIMEKGKQFKQPTVKKPARQNKIDREFFKKVESTLHSKGVQGISKFARSQGLTGTEESKYGSTSSMAEKPWRKHHNRNKKEKLRRLYKEHDDD